MSLRPLEGTRKRCHVSIEKAPDCISPLFYETRKASLSYKILYGM